MAIVTTYVCDITGKQGVDKYDFIEVTVNSIDLKANYPLRTKSIAKLVHYDVALKLGLVHNRDTKAEDVPTPTFESQLTTLLKDYIDDLVYDSVESAVNNR